MISLAIIGCGNVSFFVSTFIGIALVCYGLFRNPYKK